MKQRLLLVLFYTAPLFASETKSKDEVGHYSAASHAASSSATASALSSTHSASSVSVTQPKSDFTLEQTMSALEHQNNAIALLIPNLPLVIDKPLQTINLTAKFSGNYSIQYLPQPQLFVAHVYDGKVILFNTKGIQHSAFKTESCKSITYIPSLNLLLVHSSSRRQCQFLPQLFDLNGKEAIVFSPTNNMVTRIQYDNTLNKFIGTDEKEVLIWHANGTLDKKFQLKDANDSPIELTDAQYLPDLEQLFVKGTDATYILDLKTGTTKIKIPSTDSNVAYIKPYFLVPENEFVMVYDASGKRLDKMSFARFLAPYSHKRIVEDIRPIDRENLIFIDLNKDSDLRLETLSGDKLSLLIRYDSLTKDKYNVLGDDLSYSPSLGLFWKPITINTSFFKYANNTLAEVIRIQGIMSYKVFFDAKSNQIICYDRENKRIMFYDNPIPKHFTKEQANLLQFLHDRKDKKIILDAKQKQTLASFSEQIQNHLMAYDIDWKTTAVDPQELQEQQKQQELEKQKRKAARKKLQQKAKEAAKKAEFKKLEEAGETGPYASDTD